MSAAEDDTELRDLLLQNLENSGVLNRLKAQMRAAVFLAMEEQDRIENKAPLVNENLKDCLNTRDGRVAAALILDFLQVFDLDFTRSVFEPEINTKQLESRDLLRKDLDLDPNPKSPLLLELVKRQRQDQTKDRTRDQTNDQTNDPTKDRTRDQVCVDAQDSEDRLPAPLTQRSEPEAKGTSGLKKDLDLDLDQKEPNLQRDLDLDDVDDGDSFFDDPLPAPQKTYGCSSDSGPVLVLRRDKSLSDLSLLGPPSEELRKAESPVPSLSLGQSSSSEPSRTGASKAKGPKDSRPLSDRSGSHRLDEDVEYDDDFNSHRSSLSRSELSIGEEIEEVSIEGPEPSDKFDEKTQDLSLSQISHSADYMEDVP